MVNRNENGPLGSNITTWTQSIRRGYALSFLLYSFHDSGVFDYLKDGKPKSSKEISLKLNLNEKILRSGLNFFVHADNSIIKDNNGKFILTKIGMDRIFSNQAFFSLH